MELTGYAGAWVPAPVAADGDSHGNTDVMTDGASCDNAGVPPKRKPHGRAPQGKVWNGTVNPLKDDEGVVTEYRSTQVDGYDWFYYKDRDTQKVVHLLDLGRLWSHQEMGHYY